MQGEVQPTSRVKWEEVSTPCMRGRRSTGGMEASEFQEAKQLRDENARLKKLVTDLSLDKDALQSVIKKAAGARFRQTAT